MIMTFMSLDGTGTLVAAIIASIATSTAAAVVSVVHTTIVVSTMAFVTAFATAPIVVVTITLASVSVTLIVLNCHFKMAIPIPLHCIGDLIRVHGIVNVERVLVLFVGKPIDH